MSASVRCRPEKVDFEVVDGFLPLYDVSDAVATVAVGHLLRGERPAKPPDSMRLRDLPSIPIYEGGWLLLGERPGEELALGPGRQVLYVRPLRRPV